jgi:peptide/nickel transport system permease protein
VSIIGISMGIAIPNFFLAMVLVAIFAVQLRWLPAMGFTRITDSPVQWLNNMILPAFSLGLFAGASVARQIRAALVDVMNSNYVRTAWAMGGTAQTVVVRHALKNAAIPAVTVLGLQMTSLLGGSILIEQIFSLPGLGSYLIRALLAQDLPVILGVTTFFVLLHLIMTLLMDISYGILNPKVRVS